MKPETILKHSLLIQSGIREAVCQFNPYSSWFCSWVCSQQESSEWGKRGHTVLRYSLTDKVLQDNMQKLKIDNIEHVCLKQTYNQTQFFLNNMKTTHLIIILQESTNFWKFFTNNVQQLISFNKWTLLLLRQLINTWTAQQKFSLQKTIGALAFKELLINIFLIWENFHIYSDRNLPTLWFPCKFKIYFILLY